MVSSPSTTPKLLQRLEQQTGEEDLPPDNAADGFDSFLRQLESGHLRAAFPGKDGEWHVDSAIKSGILRIFRESGNHDYDQGLFPYRDRLALFPRADLPAAVRVVPGGSAIRRGAYLGAGVVVMPPSYINVGAYVDEGTMIDSHVLVGSCAQIGKGVHLSAGTQIGGVLEPVGAMPVIIEDHAFVGGNCGIYEGVRVGARAVLAAGVTMTASKPLWDVTRGEQIVPSDGMLRVPSGAVVIGGTRAIPTATGRACGLAADVNLIIKYRDEKTDLRVCLEGALRGMEEPIAP